MPEEQPQERRRGNRGRRARERQTFLAVFQKLDEAEKRFNISRDRDLKAWKCGNGVLEVAESNAGKLVWRTQADNKISTWSRPPPVGAVYFDAPPAYGEEKAPQQEWIGGAVYYPHPDWQGEGSDWHQFNFPVDGDEEMQQMYADQSGSGHVEMVMVMQDDVVNAGNEAPSGQASGTGKRTNFNAGAPEFVMPVDKPATGADTPAAGSSKPQTPTPSPGLKPQSTGLAAPRRPRWASMSENAGGTPSTSPMVGPAQAPKISPLQGPARAPRAQVSPQLGPAAAPGPTIQLSEESPDIKVAGDSLQWTLPDNWGKLSKYPKDFCITSPMFGVQRAASMQLAFYPGGSRTAEGGHCTVALTRGPDSAGIKFEILVNDKGIGPKVCLGRRYMGDYARPFDESEANKTQKVVVTMQVHNILG